MKLSIYDVLFWIFFVISIILVLWYIFGRSPTIEQALLVIIITFLFKIQADVASNRSGTDILRNNFIRLAKDFKEHIKHK